MIKNIGKFLAKNRAPIAIISVLGSVAGLLFSLVDLSSALEPPKGKKK